MARDTRPISWISAARKDFEKFPAGAQAEIARAAYRVVYAMKLGTDIWVIHAFQKKAKIGIKTPRTEIDLIRTRIKRLKEMLR